ncbi:Transmembrane protein [Phytophthora palmivora]|uniref:Copper transport protein n=1 Tax=Phytophthora palmivora TaxID=4796 RepID=A0A2P4XTL0_9STRA|nr:Transmembrane protein [Phytophthora palmivora]
MRGLLWTSALLAAASAHMHHNHHHELHQLHDMHAIQAHRDLAASGVSSTDYTCPVCGMSTLDSGYDNENYVTMTHGQRVYSCGMAARAFSSYDFDVTDTAYLAANMAEFIVNQTDTEAYAECTSTCAECSDGISDPVSGDSVTTDNYVYVCLKNGQKIYFASQDNKNSYLTSVNTEPRYLVDSVICSGSTCSDATNITTLSPAAQSFVADYSESTTAASATSSSSTTTESDSSSTSSGFCSGQGSVMFNGFQTSIHGSCVMLLFQPWVLNSGVKYAFGFIGCFLIALLNESLVKGREVVRQRLLVARKLRPHDKFHKMQCKATLAVLYMIQMTIAYFAMLVVMTYETGLFIALIAGFGAGFLLFKNLDQDITEERGSWRFTDPSTVRIQVEGMSCMKNCGTTVENALKNTPGVTDAVVEFDERAAYVSGSAQFSDLVAAIEGVGFTAEVNNQTRRNSNSNASPRA